MLHSVGKCTPKGLLNRVRYKLFKRYLYTEL